MRVFYGKLSAKARITLPRAVRTAMGVKPGDTLVYRISKGGVTLARAERLDRDYLKAVEATLTEWGSAEDAEAFDGL